MKSTFSKSCGPTKWARVCYYVNISPLLQTSLSQSDPDIQILVYIFFLFLFLVRCWLSLLDSDLSLSWLDLNTSEHPLIDEKPTFQVPSCRMFSVCMLDSTPVWQNLTTVHSSPYPACLISLLNFKLVRHWDRVFFFFLFVDVTTKVSNADQIPVFVLGDRPLVLFKAALALP